MIRSGKTMETNFGKSTESEKPLIRKLSTKSKIPQLYLGIIDNLMAK